MIPATCSKVSFVSQKSNGHSTYLDLFFNFISVFFELFDGYTCNFDPGWLRRAFGLTEGGIFFSMDDMLRTLIGCYFLDQVSSGTAWLISFSQSWMLVCKNLPRFLPRRWKHCFFFVTKTKTTRFFFESKSKRFFFQKVLVWKSCMMFPCVCRNMSIGTSNLNYFSRWSHWVMFNVLDFLFSKFPAFQSGDYLQCVETLSLQNYVCKYTYFYIGSHQDGYIMLYLSILIIKFGLCLNTLVPHDWYNNYH